MTKNTRDCIDDILNQYNICEETHGISDDDDEEQDDIREEKFNFEETLYMLDKMN